MIPAFRDAAEAQEQADRLRYRLGDAAVAQACDLATTSRLSFADALSYVDAANRLAEVIQAASVSMRDLRRAIDACVPIEEAAWRARHPGRRLPGSTRTARLRKKRMTALGFA